MSERTLGRSGLSKEAEQCLAEQLG